MLLWSSVTAFSQEIWQLSPWAPDSSYVISAMSSGEPTWVKVDSLGVADSIYISGDSIRLRDGAGVAQLPTASTSTKGLLSSTDWNTFNGKGGGSGTVTSITTTSPLTGGTITSTGTIGIQTASGSQAGALSSTDWTLFNGKVGGSGVTNRISLWNGTSDITSSADLFWSGSGRMTVRGTGGNPGLFVQDLSTLGAGGAESQLFFGVGPTQQASTDRFFQLKNTYYHGVGQSRLNVTYWDGTAYKDLGYWQRDDGFRAINFGGSNGYGTPKAVNTSLSNYELIDMYKSSTYRAVIGMSNNGLYLQNTTTGGGAIHFYTGEGGSPILRSTISGSGVFNIANLAGSGSRMVVASSSGDLSTSAIPTAPETFAAVGSKIQSWNSTGTFGSGKDVGFGVDPTREIDVNGDARLRGAIYDSANSAGSSGQVLTSQGSGAWTWTTPNTGTVTSVGINTGGGVTSVSGSPVTGSGNISLTLADQSASNELQTISTSGTAGNITLSNGGGTLNLNVNDADANATNELQNLTLTGQTLDISQGAGVTLPIIDVVQGSGITVNKLNGIATISASSAGSTEYIDPYIISSDTVGFILKNVMDTVQFIGVAGVTGESTTVSDSPTINMTLTGTNITGEIVDGSVTPAKLSQAYLTSEVDGSTTNEIQTLSISGSDLTISGAGGNTVTLPSGGGSSEWASLHYGSLAANTQTLTSSVWNTINFTGSSESNASIIDANHTNDEIEFVVAGTYRVDYRVSFIANADALIYSGIYSSVSSSVDGNTQMESDTDSGYKHTIMQHSYIKTAVAGEKIKLQVQPLIAHTSVAIYSNFIVTKL